MTRWAPARQEAVSRRIIVGDLNVAPLETDVWSHKQLSKVVSHSPGKIELVEKLRKSGPWKDAVSQVILPLERLHSWWSCHSKDWSAADKGRRLNHIWVTDPLADAIIGANILREARGWRRPSDHAPVTASLKM